MSLKSIKIKEITYRKLLERKKNDESISDIIDRLLGYIEVPKNIKKFFGVWKDLPEEYFKIMEADRKEIREEIDGRF